MLTTTLNKIQAYNPCEDGRKKLLKYFGKTKADDELLPFSVILDSNGLDAALWCCQTAPEYDREWRLFAVWCVRQIQLLITDRQSIDILDIVERFANREAIIKELATVANIAKNITKDTIDITTNIATKAMADTIRATISTVIIAITGISAYVIVRAVAWATAQVATKTTNIATWAAADIVAEVSKKAAINAAAWTTACTPVKAAKISQEKNLEK